MPTVLVITGAPAAGKSLLAGRLRTQLGWPLLAKDPIKESLFDSLGWSDRAWSKRVSGASYALMFDVARELTNAGLDCVLEGNFRWSETQRHFERLAQGSGVRFMQVFCTADVDVLVARMRERIAMSLRHPGHVDEAAAAELEKELRERPMVPLPLGAAPLVYDSGRDGVEDFVARVTAECRRSG